MYYKPQHNFYESMINLVYSTRQMWCYNQTSYIIQVYSNAFLP